MEVGHFYFLDNQYYQDFNDDKLMSNHETVDGEVHGRPCYCCINTSDNGIYWAIPISSQVEKYRKYMIRRLTRMENAIPLILGKCLVQKERF